MSGFASTLNKDSAIDMRGQETSGTKVDRRAEQRDLAGPNIRSDNPIFSTDKEVADKTGKLFLNKNKPEDLELIKLIAEAEKKGYKFEGSYNARGGLAVELKDDKDATILKISGHGGLGVNEDIDEFRDRLYNQLKSGGLHFGYRVDFGQGVNRGELLKEGMQLLDKEPGGAGSRMKIGDDIVKIESSTDRLEFYKDKEGALHLKCYDKPNKDGKIAVQDLTIKDGKIVNEANELIDGPRSKLPPISLGSGEGKLVIDPIQDRALYDKLNDLQQKGYAASFTHTADSFVFELKDRSGNPVGGTKIGTVGQELNDASIKELILNKIRDIE